MFTKDDTDSAKFADRLIAALIAGFCGYIFGGAIEILTKSVFGQSYGISWMVAAGFAVFGLLAPSRSRQLWSEFWSTFIGIFNSRR